MTRIFIDGAHGTVGAALLARMTPAILRDHAIFLQPEARRREPFAVHDVRPGDIVVLCLPDAVAQERAAFYSKNCPDVRLLDASAAHRCAPGWVYGLPELGNAASIARARRVANPGCFATACILLAAPLARQGAPMAFFGLTGTSARGAKAKDTPMGLVRVGGPAHRHLPEIERYGRVSPTLTTFVGDWSQGLLVQAVLPMPAARVVAAYREAYADYPQIQVALAETGEDISPLSCNGTNNTGITVAAQPDGGTLVCAVLDNLGKGAAGAAIQNLALMLGVAHVG